MPIYAVSVVLAVMSASAGVLIDNVSQLLSVVRYAYTPIKMCFFKSGIPPAACDSNSRINTPTVSFLGT